MKRILGPLIVLILSALAAHAATLHFAPPVIMDRAMSELAKRGIGLHTFTTPRRITPQTQAIVRSSPDLFYALCRYDLSEPDSSLTVTMAEWPGYQSLSFFDANTNNFMTVRSENKSSTVRLIPPDAKGLSTVTSPTARGVVLIRRLAPTKAQFEQAKKIAENDRCEIGTLPR